MVDEAFDGNFSLAARQLKMPVSTVHQYYRKGPRRYDAQVVQRMAEMLRTTPEWLFAGKGRGDELSADEVGVGYGDDDQGRYEAWYPQTVEWRVSQVVERIREAGASYLALQVFFGPLEVLEEAGLLPAHLRMSGQRNSGMEATWPSTTGRRERAHLIHVLCDYWEGVLATVTRAAT